MYFFDSFDFMKESKKSISNRSRPNDKRFCRKAWMRAEL